MVQLTCEASVASQVMTTGWVLVEAVGAERQRVGLETKAAVGRANEVK